MRNVEQDEQMQIGLIGYGAIGRQVRNFLLQNGFLDKNIYCFDDAEEENEEKRIWGFWSFTEKKFSHLNFIPTIGYLSIEIKSNVMELLKSSNLNMFSYIHPSSFVNPTAIIGNGVVIYPFCNVDQNVKIEDGVLLNNSCTISHDSSIGMNTYVAPGVVTSGAVSIGENCFIGSGAVISNLIKIGKNCRIGVATCVSKNLSDGSSAIGNPIKIKDNLNLL